VLAVTLTLVARRDGISPKEALKGMRDYILARRAGLSGAKDASVAAGIEEVCDTQMEDGYDTI
jgi:hypothetical protein